jgi:hypothetical protein
MATEQDIANILADIGEAHKRLAAALVANAVFQQTGATPKQDRLEREPKSAGPRGSD